MIECEVGLTKFDTTYEYDRNLTKSCLGQIHIDPHKMIIGNAHTSIKLQQDSQHLDRLSLWLAHPMLGFHN